MRHSTPLAARALFVAATVAFAAACESSPPLATLNGLDANAPNSFAAQVSDGTSSVTLSGAAEVARSSDGADFTGAFTNYPIVRGDSATRFHFTLIRLGNGEGEGLILGHVAPNADLPNGTYRIEEERNLRPPFGFVARFVERGEGRALRHTVVTEGTVGVEAGAARLQGRFELTLADGRTVTGTFGAATRD